MCFVSFWLLRLLSKRLALFETIHITLYLRSEVAASLRERREPPGGTRAIVITEV